TRGCRLRHDNDRSSSKFVHRLVGQFHDRPISHFFVATLQHDMEYEAVVERDAFPEGTCLRFIGTSNWDRFIDGYGVEPERHPYARASGLLRHGSAIRYLAKRGQLRLRGSESAKQRRNRIKLKL